jgi:ABC-2 type transport system ATP-binding protein
VVISGAAIHTEGLSKSYRVGHIVGRRVRALEPLDLEVPRGEILGYLGPNGSGKTTTLKLLFGLVVPDAGTATVLGEPLDSRGWRLRTGYLPEHPYFYDYLTPREYMDYAGRLLGMGPARRKERSELLLDRLGLLGAADVAMRRFSKGMVQRAGLAQALLNDPELVVLDEPMSGLDPIGRRLVRELILELREQGKTVFFSTHILSDAETICDRVALLRGGRLIEVGRLDEILAMEVACFEVLASGLDQKAIAGLPSGVEARRQLGERLVLEVTEAALAGVIQGIERSGGRILSVQAVRRSLEDHFFAQMGEGPGDTWASD